MGTEPYKVHGLAATNCAAHSFIPSTLALRKVENNSMVERHKQPAEWSRRRTRFDSPDIDEAISAAQGLTTSLDSQIEIAAQLIGLPEDEVRPAVLRSAAEHHSSRAQSAPTSRNPRRVVVIKRRSPRVRLK